VKKITDEVPEAIKEHVPVWLGVAHQVGAFFLLSSMTFTLHRFSK